MLYKVQQFETHFLMEYKALDMKVHKICDTNKLQIISNFQNRQIFFLKKFLSQVTNFEEIILDITLVRIEYNVKTELKFLLPMSLFFFGDCKNENGKTSSTFK